MIDGSKWLETQRIQSLPEELRPLFYENFARNFAPLSPFGFFDSNIPVDKPPYEQYDPSEPILYDYFGGIVNNGDQDTLYLRTLVDIKGEMVTANVYYRLVFRNTIRNYAETFQDTGYTWIDGNTYGAGDGIWTPGEVFFDENGNGFCDPIVDPGERRLQRIVSLPGNPQAIVQDLGPAVRFNVEYFDAAQKRFVAPFSDTGWDGLFDSQEEGFVWPCGCTDPRGDNSISLVEGFGLENDGVLGRVNFKGILPENQNWNPYLPNSISSGFGLQENPFVGIKRFGYPESAGTTVVQPCLSLRAFNAMEPLPPLANLEYVVLEPITNNQFVSNDLLFPVLVSEDTACAGFPNDDVNRYVNIVLQNKLGGFYRFSAAGVFDEEGWLRCAGVRDNFAFLRPGDEVFVWAFLIPPPSVSADPEARGARVPVPPGYYPMIEKRGNRLRLDLSTVPGGTPTPEQLQGVPAIYRAPYLPPALRIDFALEGEDSEREDRNLRVWPIQGANFEQAGIRSQGTPSSIPIRGTVLTVVPGSNR